MSRWHWLRHDWGKWEPYEHKYNIYLDSAGKHMVTRTRIRQKRTCTTCGTMQDTVVAELHQ